MNLTPKKDFLAKKPLADAHRELVVSTPFREALNAALLEYVLSLDGVATIETAGAMYYKIAGAREFVQCLLNVAEMPKPVPSPLPTNLNHGVK